MKKKNKEIKTKKTEKKQPEIIESNLDIVPIRHYDENVDAFRLENGSYLDLLKVLSIDGDNADEDEKSYNIWTFMKFHRLNNDDIKLTALNFPVNASKQKEFKKRKLERTNDPARILWLQRQIAELEKVESHIDRREFYMMIFGKTKEMLTKTRKSVLDVLGGGKSRNVEEIDMQHKIHIEKQFGNMNSLILLEADDDTKI